MYVWAYRYLLSGCVHLLKVVECFYANLFPKMLLLLHSTKCFAPRKLSKGIIHFVLNYPWLRVLGAVAATATCNNGARCLLSHSTDAKLTPPVVRGRNS